MTALAALLAVFALASPVAGEVPVPPQPSAQQLELNEHFIDVRVDNQTATVYVLSPHQGRFIVRARYKVATGKSGFATPRGVFFTANEIKRPSWTAPYASWVPKEQQGHTFGPDDERNPLTGTWTGLGGLPPGRSDIGFHGTRKDSSIGTLASHGCLRMHTEDSINLARITEVGTMVIIR